MRTLPLVLLVVASVTMASCKETHLDDIEVVSAKGGVRAHAPGGPGWTCTRHDAAKETYEFQGIKCKDVEGVVLTAKLYEVDTADARTAQLFCMQDWKQAYGSLFRVIATTRADVVDWRGVPACEVVLEGTTEKGPWRIWEMHAPNCRKMLQMNVSGSLPVIARKQAVIDAWRNDVRYDLKVPGQAP